MSQILIVDDDGHIREVVRFTLESAGHTVIEAKNGEEGWTRFQEGGFDVILLDVVMPEADGLDLCKRVRGESAIPIIFVSSRDDVLDRVLGLELGGDDYIAKPFSPRELLARIKAVLRRQNPVVVSHDAPPQRKEHGALALDMDRHCCTWRGQQVVLTVTEFALLEALISAPGRVLSRDQMVDRAYGDGHAITERTVDSHLRRVRAKFGTAGAPAELIETVYGVGYRLREKAFA